MGANDHSTMAVATGPTTVVSTKFDVPADIGTGPSDLSVVANGIASAKLSVGVGNEPVASGISPNLVDVTASSTAFINVTVVGTNGEGHGGDPTLTLGASTVSRLPPGH